MQFKAVSDLVGIKIAKGTLLKDAQKINPDPLGEKSRKHFMKDLPLQHVGGKLRVRLLRIDNLPQDMQHGQKIFVRVVSGQRSRYGEKLFKSPKDKEVMCIKKVSDSFVWTSGICGQSACDSC